jgi:uncharacterized protein (DUF1684 family)
VVPFGRAFRHAFSTPLASRRALAPAALQRIGAAIAAAEAAHSGEIRFAVEGSLPWSYLRRDAPVRQRATMVFAKLRVWDTEQNNGVLLYLELADRAVELVADRGIARKVPQAGWEAICAAMQPQLQAQDVEGAVTAAIAAIGAVLAEHYPLAPGAANPNELPDQPVVL